jgi:ankyrin repeat protein
MKPIHYFARRALLPESVVSNEKGLDYLMKFGADINAPNKYGETPLHNAILQGNLLMVQLLLSKDPDLTLTNRYASTRSSPSFFFKGAVDNQLMSYCHDCRYNENVLHYAIISQKKDMVDKILDLGIDPRVGSATNGTPLESAKLLSSGQGKEVYEIIQSALPSFVCLLCERRGILWVTMIYSILTIDHFVTSRKGDEPRHCWNDRRRKARVQT